MSSYFFPQLPAGQAGAGQPSTWTPTHFPPAPDPSLPSPHPFSSAPAAPPAPQPPLARIFWDLPIPVQKHVLTFLPPPDLATVRACCTATRALVNDLVPTLTLDLSPNNPPHNRALALTLRYDPLDHRFPCARALHITALRHWRPPAPTPDAPTPDPQADLIALLNATASFIRRATSFTLTLHDPTGERYNRTFDAALSPTPALVSALQSVLAPAAATLTHLTLTFPPLPAAPPLISLPLLLPPAALPALTHLHILADLSTEPLPTDPPHPPRTALRTLSLATLPLHPTHPDAAARLPTAFPALTSLTLGYQPAARDLRTPHLHPLLALPHLAHIHIEGGLSLLAPPATTPLAALCSLSSLTLSRWRLEDPAGVEALSGASSALRHLALLSLHLGRSASFQPLGRLTGLTSLELNIQRLRGAVPVTAAHIGIGGLAPLGRCLRRFVLDGPAAHEMPGLREIVPRDLAYLLQDEETWLPFEFDC